MTKILVADDESDLELLIKQKFRQKIREQQYDFVFALNGNDAIEKLAAHPDIDVILSDINMPEMDGLTLLSKLADLYPLSRTVMVSAYGDMDNIRSAMNKGAFDFVTKPVNFGDLELTIEKTIKHVSQLKETLKAIKENNILKMYVDENVLKFMGSREFEDSIMQNETIEATVVFIDICGFTAITEVEPANTVVQMLNNYFDVIVKGIIAQNGHVDKFIGDAVMAVFRGKHHLDRAIDASLVVRNNIAQLSTEFTQTAFTPALSIGIASGELISGNIGSANLRRLDYTVIGDVANTASRLQSAAGSNQIVIAENAYLQIKDSFNCKKIGDINLKNKQLPITVYEVID
ncbi:MAG: adenylate/guanylate cyclase domain-containing protein [Sediminibacterium sp.]|nr:adenylate/guanylate cyclase domain-containing protein [Sediminibacterium sp.]